MKPDWRTVYGVNLTPPSNRRGCPTLFHQWCTQWIFRLSLYGQLNCEERTWRDWGANFLRKSICISSPKYAGFSLRAGLWNCPTPSELEIQCISLDTYPAKMSKILNLILQYTNKNAYKSSFFLIYFSFRALNKCINQRLTNINSLKLIFP